MSCDGYAAGAARKYVAKSGGVWAQTPVVYVEEMSVRRARLNRAGAWGASPRVFARRLAKLSRSLMMLTSLRTVALKAAALTGSAMLFSGAAIAAEGRAENW